MGLGSLVMSRVTRTPESSLIIALQGMISVTARGSMPVWIVILREAYWSLSIPRTLCACRVPCSRKSRVDGRHRGKTMPVGHITASNWHLFKVSDLFKGVLPEIRRV